MAQRHHSRRRKKQQLDPRWIVAGAVLLIAAAIVLIIATREDSAPTNAANALPVENFTLPNFQGQPVSLTDFRGQVVLINFWAWWCPPCKAEMPDLHAFYLDHKDQGFALLAIHADAEAEKGADFIATNGFTFPVAQDSTGSIFYQFGSGSLPQSVLIGPDGTLIKTYEPGMITPAMLERDVLPLLRG